MVPLLQDTLNEFVWAAATSGIRERMDVVPRNAPNEMSFCFEILPRSSTKNECTFFFISGNFLSAIGHLIFDSFL